MTCEQFMQAHPDPKEAREFLLDGKEDEDGVEVLKRALDAAEEHFFGHHSLMQKQRSLSGDYRGEWARSRSIVSVVQFNREASVGSRARTCDIGGASSNGGRPGVSDVQSSLMRLWGKIKFEREHQY